MPVRPNQEAEPIPGYRLIERLGRGGFGEVWKAEAPGGLMKAIKFVYGDIGEAKDKDKDDKASAGDQELRALNRIKTIRHPFILSLERVDVLDGQLIIVMELADRNLFDRFRDCRSMGLPGIPRDELLRYMEETAEALDLLNTEYQLQHLDIKPQNLFLVRNHIKVGDFGLVKDLAGMKASITGGVTPVYASPETFEGWVSRFCDQYSLAIVYQELLTGLRPFDGTSPGQLLKQHLEGEPNLAPLPPGDQPAIRRALAKKPNERFPSCSSLVRALRGEPNDGVPEGPVGEVTAPPLTERRGPGMPDEHPTGNKSTASRSVAEVTPKGTPMAPTDTSRVALQPSAPVEFKGGGVLYPAVVLGIGQMGVAVVQKLREALHEQFGALENVANLRLLAVDTDPDAINATLRLPKGAALSARETMLVRLNRPAHFLKPREGHLDYSTWLEPQLLYRIPRNQQTAGLRCLGRLAFMDHYRDIAERVRTELAACTEPEAVAAADRKTKLGLRTNKPRVWVVASLAGGTGSGMFIDLAYLSRFFLKQLGYAQPDVVGLLFLPPPTHQPMRPLAVGNTFAALSELHHWSLPGNTFMARFAPKEPPLTDAEPPFGRCLLVPLDAEDRRNPRLAGLAAGLLYRDLFTPLGRSIDARRADLGPAPRGTTDPPLHTFGINRFSWPRRALVTLIARKICHKITTHWTTKEVGALQDEVVAWAKDQWSKRGMQADRLLLGLKAAVQGDLDEKAPEEVFEAHVKELAKKVPPGGNPEPRDVLATMDELEKLIGKPEGDKPPPKTPQLVDSLDKAAHSQLGICEQKLAEMAVHLLEQPRFRLAGAEEAIRQFNSLIQQTLEQQETLCNEFVTKSNAAYARIHALLEAIRAAPAARRKPPPVAAELLDMVRVWPTLRLRGLIMQRLLTILRSLRGNCPEYLREITFCRARLLDLVKVFEKVPTISNAMNLGPGRDLFPPGCATLDEAVNRFIEQVTPEQLVELDGRIQTVLRQKFTALVHVCTTAANILPNVEDALQREMESYVAERLGAANAIEMFLAQNPQNLPACEEIVKANEKAAPPLKLDKEAAPNEIGLVVVPSEDSAARFRELAERALPSAELVAGPKGDDVVFYRELVGITMADLPQTGYEARQAYQEMLVTENFSPHTRTDITEWKFPDQK